eukprot:7501512-Pyramimonas_sp.AAC.1
MIRIRVLMLLSATTHTAKALRFFRLRVSPPVSWSVLQASCPPSGAGCMDVSCGLSYVKSSPSAVTCRPHCL